MTSRPTAATDASRLTHLPRAQVIEIGKRGKSDSAPPPHTHAQYTNDLLGASSPFSQSEASPNRQSSSVDDNISQWEHSVRSNLKTASCNSSAYNRSSLFLPLSVCRLPTSLALEMEEEEELDEILRSLHGLQLVSKPRATGTWQATGIWAVSSCSLHVLLLCFINDLRPCWRIKFVLAGTALTMALFVGRLLEWRQTPASKSVILKTNQLIIVPTFTIL